MKRGTGETKGYCTWRLNGTVYRYAVKTEVGYVASAILQPDGTCREVGPEGLEASKHPGVDRFLRMLAAQVRYGRAARSRRSTADS